MPTSGGGMKDFVLLPLNDVIPGRIPTIFAQILPCRPPHVRSEISSLTHLQQFDLPSDWSAIEIGAAAAAWHYIFGEDQSAVVTRTVGGNATPVARRARLAIATTRAKLRAAIDDGASTLKPLLQALADKATPSALDADIKAKPPTLVLSVDQGEELFLAEAQD